jgi:hypothetical protein
MSKFAVGDRVRVFMDVLDASRVRLAGSVVGIDETHPNPNEVQLDALQRTYRYRDDELELIASAALSMRAVDLYAGRVVKLYQADQSLDDTCRWAVIKDESDDALLVDLVAPFPGVPLERFQTDVLVYKATVCAILPTKFTVDDVRG